MSAFVYEVGKGMLGADLSRGLFASAVTDFVGGRDLTTPGGLPADPSDRADPVDLVRGRPRTTWTCSARGGEDRAAGVSAMRLLGVGFPIHPPGVLGTRAVQRTWGGTGAGRAGAGTGPTVR